MYLNKSLSDRRRTKLMYRFHKQRGAVSLFVVIFAALLMTVVTVSFVRIMIQSQQQASATDLSQSAFDSAQAGVEDAKRALLRHQNYCSTHTVAECAADKLTIDSPTLACNDAVRTLEDVASISNPGTEVKVKINGNDNDLDQAYTCVKIQTQTDDYIGELEKDESKFIPLISASDFNKVKIEWFSPKDLKDSTTADVPTFVSGTPLLMSDWNVSQQNRPSIMRSQLIQFSSTGAGFSLDEFDNNTANASNNTLFLYPSDIIDTTKSFTDNTRRVVSGGPIQVRCNDLGNTEPFACFAFITLPKSSDSHVQYLNLKSLYNGAHYRVTLLKDAIPVKFDNVQPSIDSTGRANDLFRRVQTRVEMTNVNFPYPQAEIYTTGNLCKNFMVTDSEGDYDSLNTDRCEP